MELKSRGTTSWKPRWICGAQKNVTFSAARRLQVEILDMFDDRVAAPVEQRVLEGLPVVNVHHFDAHAVVLFGHGFDAIDDGCAVVIAIGEANRRHLVFAVS